MDENEAIAYDELRDLWVTLWLALNNASTWVRKQRRISKLKEAETIRATALAVHGNDRYRSPAARNMVRVLAVHSEPRAVFLELHKRMPK